MLLHPTVVVFTSKLILSTPSCAPPSLGRPYRRVSVPIHCCHSRKHLLQHCGCILQQYKNTTWCRASRGGPLSSLVFQVHCFRHRRSPPKCLPTCSLCLLNPSAFRSPSVLPGN
ncbi:hypothetical protein IWX90DRAFT_194846 [Phyllosticta citrichinensis]|uniref:Secreted protein n=1 Tax=Phyllosticta citrichinensis TaxID=1130410 RepID=A0ABR1XX13_9PEZI